MNGGEDAGQDEGTGAWYILGGGGSSEILLVVVVAVE